MNIKRKFIIIEKSSNNSITVLPLEQGCRIKAVKRGVSLWEFSTLENLTKFCKMLEKSSLFPPCAVYEKNRNYRMKINSESKTVRSIAGEYARVVLPTNRQLALTNEYWNFISDENTVKTFSLLSL